MNNVRVPFVGAPNGPDVTPRREDGDDTAPPRGLQLGSIGRRYVLSFFVVVLDNPLKDVENILREQFENVQTTYTLCACGGGRRGHRGSLALTVERDGEHLIVGRENPVHNDVGTRCEFRHVSEWGLRLVEGVSGFWKGSRFRTYL